MFLLCGLFLCSQRDPEHDRDISEHVLRMHRYRTPGEQDGEGKSMRTLELSAGVLMKPEHHSAQ